jgi:rhodanese-related sulfurtransferase
MTRTFVVFLFTAAFLSACSNTPAPSPTNEAIGQQVYAQSGVYTDVSAAELEIMLADKDFTFVNVHIPFEGTIPGTDLSISYDEIEQNLDQLPSGKDAKIVLYCRSDRMSRIAAETLVGLGYTNIWNLDGGMVAWEQAGLPLDR